MAEEDVLRMAAVVVDKATGPLGQVQKALRDVQRTMREAGDEAGHGTAHRGVTELTGRFHLLHRSMEQVSELARTSLKSGLEAAGISALSLTGIMIGLTKAVTGFASRADELNRLSRTTGIAAQSFRELEYAGVRAGVSMESVAQASSAFGRSMFDFRRATGDLYQEIRQLNPALAEMLRHTRTNEQAMNVWMDVMAQIPDIQERMRVSERVFGTRDMALMVSEGKTYAERIANYNRARAEARKAVGVVSDADLKKGEEFNTALGELTKTLGSLRDELGPALPALTELVGQLRDYVAANREPITGGIVKSLHDLGEALKGVDWSEVGNELIATLRTIRDTVRDVDGAVQSVGGWKTAFEGFLAVLGFAAAARVLSFAGALFRLAAGLRAVGAASATLPAAAAVAGGVVAGSVVHLKGMAKPEDTKTGPEGQQQLALQRALLARVDEQLASSGTSDFVRRQLERQRDALQKQLADMEAARDAGRPVWPLPEHRAPDAAQPPEHPRQPRWWWQRLGIIPSAGAAEAEGGPRMFGAGIAGVGAGATGGTALQPGEIDRRIGDAFQAFGSRMFGAGAAGIGAGASGATVLRPGEIDRQVHDAFTALGQQSADDIKKGLQGKSREIEREGGSIWERFYKGFLEKMSFAAEAATLGTDAEVAAGGVAAGVGALAGGVAGASGARRLPGPRGFYIPGSNAMRASLGDSPGAAGGETGGARRTGGRGGAVATPNAEVIREELEKAGMPPAAVAAALGSMRQESYSNLDPTAHNNIKGGHTGIIQWDRNRWAGLERWAAENKLDPYDARTQARYFIWEGQHGDRQTRQGFDRMMHARTVEEAHAGMRQIERYGPGEEGGRLGYARQYAEAMKRGRLDDPRSFGVAPGPMGALQGFHAGAERFGLEPGKSARGVDPRLVDILRTASAYLPEGYTARLQSGLRPGDPRFHGRGLATDVRLYDPQGRPIPNYQDPRYFAFYERYAQMAKKVQSEKYPELDPRFAWGGYFGGGFGTYGAADLMHFDLGGKRGRAGSFETGLYPGYRRQYAGDRYNPGMGDVASWRLPSAAAAKGDREPGVQRWQDAAAAGEKLLARNDPVPVTGNIGVTIDVSGPRGTKVKSNADGVVGPVKLRRGTTMTRPSDED